jgi:type II secretory pathway pseudopilin PulG
VIIIGIVVVILAVIAFFAFNAIKENKEEQERLAQLQADRNAAYSAISGYADAISKLDFNGSDDYCVPGSNPIKDMLEVIPGADYIFGGASLLGGITGIEFEFNLDVSESDIEISDSGDRATAPVTVSIPQLDYEKDVTITLEKDGGDWLISSAR